MKAQSFDTIGPHTAGHSLIQNYDSPDSSLIKKKMRSEFPSSALACYSRV